MVISNSKTTSPLFSCHLLVFRFCFYSILPPLFSLCYVKFLKEYTTSSLCFVNLRYLQLCFGIWYIYIGYKIPCIFHLLDRYQILGITCMGSPPRDPLSDPIPDSPCPEAGRTGDPSSGFIHLLSCLTQQQQQQEAE